uniref:Uncharacterized protein n=1 Tax=Ascaris lumbricoides TaxID=6252 RepID=A0A0M3IEA4_ASCLU
MFGINARISCKSVSPSFPYPSQSFPVALTRSIQLRGREVLASFPDFESIFCEAVFTVSRA